LVPDPHDWILEFFRARGTIPGSTEEEQLKVDYFDAGFIDSLGVVVLITSLENTFQVRFEASDLQEKRFFTIGGLIEIVRELLEGRPGAGLSSSSLPVSSDGQQPIETSRSMS
jgi:acyl carrier protein